MVGRRRPTRTVAVAVAALGVLAVLGVVLLVLPGLVVDHDLAARTWGGRTWRVRWPAT